MFLFIKLDVHVSSKANLPELWSDLNQVEGQVRGQVCGIVICALDVAVTQVLYLHHDTIELFQIK